MKGMCNDCLLEAYFSHDLWELSFFFFVFFFRTGRQFLWLWSVWMVFHQRLTGMALYSDSVVILGLRSSCSLSRCSSGEWKQGRALETLTTSQDWRLLRPSCRSSSRAWLPWGKKPRQPWPQWKRSSRGWPCSGSLPWSPSPPPPSSSSWSWALMLMFMFLMGPGWIRARLPPESPANSWSAGRGGEWAIPSVATFDFCLFILVQSLSLSLSVPRCGPG